MDIAAIIISLGSLIIAVLSAICAVLSVREARRAWKTAHTAIAQQALMNFLHEYRSAEMMDAVKSLWDLHRENPGDSMVRKYKEIFEEDDAKLRRSEPLERAALVASTLHYKRRLVTHFYVYLALLVDQKILPATLIYASWSKRALGIIPKVLVPLEIGFAEVLDTGDLSVVPILQRLYNQAPETKNVNEDVTSSRGAL